MNSSTKAASRPHSKSDGSKPADLLQQYQIVVYDRAIHPELFVLEGRQRYEGPKCEMEAWVMRGRHALRFETDKAILCEVLSPDDQILPNAGTVAGFFCAGERDFDRKFPDTGMNYMTTVQTETLSEHLYRDTMAEMLDHAREVNAVQAQWDDAVGRCLSMIDVQKYRGEIHAQSYHLIASGGIVVRTQTIFELLG
jgi:hypothetical protein